MKISLFISHIVLIIIAFATKAHFALPVCIVISALALLYFYNRSVNKIDHDFKKMLSQNDFMIKARDNLLRGVNHELRAPLSRMKVDLEFIEDQSIKKSLGSDIDQMHELVNELMDIEKIKSKGIEKDSLNLTAVVKEVVETLHIDHDQLFLNTEEEFLIDGNRDQLRKLFKNLIENAYKYKSQAGKVNINLTQKGNNTVVTIMNEGSTIEGKDLPFIFEPFFRVKNKDERVKKDGIGIGLNICKEIIEAHKAKIQVSSKADYGTTFKLTF